MKFKISDEVRLNRKVYPLSTVSNYGIGKIFKISSNICWVKWTNGFMAGSQTRATNLELVEYEDYNEEKL